MTSEKTPAAPPARRATKTSPPASPPEATPPKAPPRRGRRTRAEEAERVRAILAGLDELYPEADCELVHKNAFELLVATILSAQCTDKVVNTVTPALFARYPDAASLAAADPAEVEQLVAKTGFFRQKTKNIIGAATILAREHGGEVPRDMEALRQLPGVARKTANVVLGTAYGIPSGVVVDTHIARLSGRLGLTREEDPVKIEQDLMRAIPQDRWIQFGHQLIWHGRRVCAARKPQCETCLLAPQCPSAFQV
ncbi:MAG TPA: endonuclease III [Polyangia bacterium]|nr:endonuclease III [Polyangia bacterium]